MSLSNWAVARRAAIPAVMAVGVAGFPLAFGTQAQAAVGDDGTFYVNVYDSQTGDDVAGMMVTLIDALTGATVGMPLTSNADGVVVFENLPDGTYLALVHDAAGKYQDKYTRSEKLAGEDDDAYRGLALLTNGIEVGRVEGKVTADGAPYGDAEVWIYPATATQASIESGAVRAVEVVETDGYGGYYYGNDDDYGSWSAKLPEGQYKLQVIDEDSKSCAEIDDGDPYTYYDGYVCSSPNDVWIGGTSADDAAATTVLKAKNVKVGTTVLDVADGGGDDVLVGTVSTPGGAPLDEIEVDLLQQCGDDWRVVDSDVTGDDGTYGFDEVYQFELETYTYYGYYGEYSYEYCDYSGYGPVAADKTYTLRFSDYADEYGAKYLGGIDYEYSYYGDVPAGVETFSGPTEGVLTKNMTLSAVPLDTATGLHGRVADDTSASVRSWVTIWDVNGNRVESKATRRDGTWSLPTSELAPGLYKIEVGSTDNTVSGWYGGHDFESAVAYTVAPGPSTDAGSSAVARKATLSGAVTLATVAGKERHDAWVTLYDEDGWAFDGIETSDEGAFSLRLAPGTYYAQGSGEVSSYFDDSDLRLSAQPMIPEFWNGAYDVDAAAPLVLGSGGTKTITIALDDNLLATAKPTISGTRKVGKTLTAKPGTWNVDDLEYHYQWKRGTTKIGTDSPKYKVVKKDAGKSITVTVTAVDPDGDFVDGSAKSAAIKIKK